MTEGSLLNDFIEFSRDQLAVMESVIRRLQHSPADFGPLNDLDEAILNLSTAVEYLEKPAIAATLQNLQAIPIKLRSSQKPLPRELQQGLLNLHECLLRLIDHLESDLRLGVSPPDEDLTSLFPEDLPRAPAYSHFVISTRTDFANLLFLLKGLADNEDQRTLLGRCLTILENLHDAADAVNSPELKEFYFRWATEFNELLDSCKAGNHISPLSLIDFVKKFPEILAEAVDKLTASSQPEEPLVSEAPEEVFEAESVEAPTTEILEEERAEEAEDEKQFYVVTGDIRSTLQDLRLHCENFSDQQQQPSFEAVHHCGESIAALRAAFLSCGSKGLAHFCTQWLEKTNKLGFDLKEGKKVDPQFMFTYLEQLLAVLPRDETGVVESTPMPSQPPEPLREEEVDLLESELFRKLSDSVNASMSNISKTELSSFHDILEEMLEGETDAVDEKNYDDDPFSAIVDELLEPNHDDD